MTDTVRQVSCETVGTRGPRMIGRITAWVDGMDVGRDGG